MALYRSTWGTVSIFRCSTEDILRFIAHHLDPGADQIQQIPLSSTFLAKNHKVTEKVLNSLFVDISHWIFYDKSRHA